MTPYEAAMNEFPLGEDATRERLIGLGARRVHLLSFPDSTHPYNIGCTEFNDEMCTILWTLVRNASLPLTLIEKNLPLVSKLEEFVDFGLANRVYSGDKLRGYGKGDLFDSAYVKRSESNTRLDLLENIRVAVVGLFSGQEQYTVRR